MATAAYWAEFAPDREWANTAICTLYSTRTDAAEKQTSGMLHSEFEAGSWILFPTRVGTYLHLRPGVPGDEFRAIMICLASYDCAVLRTRVPVKVHRTELAELGLTLSSKSLELIRVRQLEQMRNDGTLIHLHKKLAHRSAWRTNEGKVFCGKYRKDRKK